ncbi:MAG TPA: Gfo/Idh/MocA family oxidoreductase, partial [Chthonomonadaceae bacterium]|nr:Gfo/Idh/MocA family oxidoreductase [Chthonomonadaceae bacterium]
AAQAALQAGAHVICETPFTGDALQAEALVRLAAERERLLMPAFCHRFHPPTRFVRELVQDDDIGLPTLFRCLFSDYRAAALGTDAPSAAPIGALMETALHGVDLFRAFCGEVTFLAGKTLRAHPDSPVEDTVALALQSDRALGTVEAVWNTPGGRNVVEIYGTAGACVLDYDTGTLRAFTADQPVWRQHEEGGPDCYERELAHFADAARGLQPLEVTGEDGARAVTLCAEV